MTHKITLHNMLAEVTRLEREARQKAHKGGGIAYSAACLEATGSVLYLFIAHENEFRKLAADIKRREAGGAP